jgi:hypothetical protein
MKKKWSILFLLIPLAVLAGMLWTSPRKPKPVVLGNPSSQDLAAIEAAVRKDMRQRILPVFSWAGIKALPANFKAYRQYNIAEVELLGSSIAKVKVSKSTNPSEPRWVCEYELSPDATGWKITGITAAVVTAYTHSRPQPRQRDSRFTPGFAPLSKDTTNLLIPESLHTFVPGRFTKDKSLTELTLSPGGYEDAIISTPRPSPATPTSKTGLTNLMPVGP